MRKIEREMLEAIRCAHGDAEGPIFRSDNTTVLREHESKRGTPEWWRRDVVKLHGNTIAIIELDGRLYISTAGWNTATTRSRLSAILSRFAPDYRVNSVRGALILSKMVPIPSRERNGMVPCSRMKVAKITSELKQVGIYD